MVGAARSACLPPLVSGLRHYRTMANGESNKKVPLLRLFEWLRLSAWLPPGLALGWLATLATFIHTIGITLIAWATTVSLVVLVTWRSRIQNQEGSPSGATRAITSTAPGVSASGDSSASVAPDKADKPNVTAQETQWAPAPSADVKQAATPSASPALISAPRPGDWMGAISPPSDLMVLTAEEAASVLRVDTETIITSISNGELPGNRIGSHWRVDQGALIRWLHGAYGDLTRRESNR
jgi:excisionase family DNA binding protein